MEGAEELAAASTCRVSEVGVVPSEPHELLPCLCQRSLCRLLLVVAGEPSGAGWTMNRLLHHKVSLVGRDVPPSLFSAAVGSVLAQAEVGVVLSVIIKTLPASHTLKYTNMIRKRYGFLSSNMVMDLNIS